MGRTRLVVVGGGAAGFFCAVNAARMEPELEVTIVEKTSRVLSKVKLSGGGRCNLTHACFEISEMAKQYPRGKNFLKKALHQFSGADTVRWFQERGVGIKQETDGRMFPVTDSSQTIVDCLLREAGIHKVHLLLNQEIGHMENADRRWLVKSRRKTIEADFVCIACGGYPKTAAYAWLQSLGHTIVGPVPSLFTFNIPENDITSLMGVSVRDASIRVLGGALHERGALLITHWGMSGPAILRLSAWGARDLAAMRYDFRVLVNWVPALRQDALRGLLQSWRMESPAKKIRNGNPFSLPQRLWVYHLQQSGISPELRWRDLPAKERERLIQNLHGQEFAVRGKTTFKEEFVTAGGISLSEVDVNTMMSKRKPNLFFVGEILDVDGTTGGFNLQHAWTSGFIAARAISQETHDLMFLLKGGEKS